jgi:hypothetical protein
MPAVGEFPRRDAANMPPKDVFLDGIAGKKR